MVEQCFLLKLEDGRWRLEVMNVLTSIHLLLITLTSKNHQDFTGRKYFHLPASLSHLIYFNNFLISSIRISLSGWYFPVSTGVLPSGSS